MTSKLTYSSSNNTTFLENVDILLTVSFVNKYKNSGNIYGGGGFDTENYDKEYPPWRIWLHIYIRCNNNNIPDWIGSRYMFQSCVGKKIIERITNRLWSYTKIALFGPLFQINLWNDLFMEVIFTGVVFL